MKKMTAVFTSVLASVLMLSGCGGSGTDAGKASGSNPITAQEVQDALKSKKKITLTLWGWAKTQYDPAIKQFEAEHPNIKIDFVTGVGSTEMYTKYQNTVEAKTGIPDVMQWEYGSIPQYATSGSLLNFSSETIDSQIGKKYNDAAWKSVHFAGGLYGIPTDQGPTVMFYRKDILDQFGLKVPTTWEEFEKTGIALHQKDPSKYLSYYLLDVTATPFLNMLNYAAATPWTIKDEKTVQLDLQNQKVKEVSDFIQRCIKEGVMKPVSPQSDGYSKGYSQGDVVSVINGSWFSGSMKNEYPDLSGKWRVALPPSWQGDEQKDNAVFGGSSFAISAFSPREKQAAAIGFADWMGSNAASVKILGQQGLFLAAKSYQSDASIKQETDAYFGGQKINEVYFKAADAIKENVPNLPFMQEVNTSFTDIVVPSFTNGSSLYKALGKWQGELRQWGDDQGFKVTVKGE